MEDYMTNDIEDLDAFAAANNLSVRTVRTRRDGRLLSSCGGGGGGKGPIAAMVAANVRKGMDHYEAWQAAYDRLLALERDAGVGLDPTPAPWHVREDLEFEPLHPVGDVLGFGGVA